MRAPWKPPALPAVTPPRPRGRLCGKHAAVQHALAGATIDDGTAYGLRPSNPAAFVELMQEVDATIDSGVNDSTARGERSAWDKYYKPYCAMLRTALWRGVNALRNPLHEGAFVAGLAQWTWTHMQPRRRTDPAPRVDSVRNVSAVA